MNPLDSLCREQRVIVCAGAGGVGKTSVSCALAIAAARRGRRVLAVTIDPSRRLGEALGVGPGHQEPVPLARDRLAAVGVQPPGTLDAWMLDPQRVSDAVVRRFSRTPEEAERLLQNRIYQNVTAMVAGMQEYTAVEAMHEFVTSNRYDLVVLDTPPSRHALHFLDAPSRITRFLDGRIFRFFLPGEGGLMKRAAGKVIERVFDHAFGPANRADLMTFFASFSGVLRRIGRDAAELREFFRRPEVAFLVVTSPAQEALDEARYLERRTRDELALHLRGTVLNRSLARDDPPYPTAALLPDLPAEALGKLQRLADAEQRERTRHRELLGRLRADAQDGRFVVAAPYLPGGVSDLSTLAALVDTLVDDAPAPGVYGDGSSPMACRS